MKITRVLLVGVVAVAAALAGAVMLGSTTAGVKSTYYACADATTGALRRVPAEERCEEGEERLVWSDGQSEPTPALKDISCEISFSGKLFVKNIKSYSGFDSALVLPDGCATTWSGMTNVKLKATVTFERSVAGKFKWIESQIGFGSLQFTTDKNCHGPEWGCTPAPGTLNDGAAGAQLNILYGSCTNGVTNPCEVNIRFAGTEYLKDGEPLFVWVVIARIYSPGQDNTYSEWDKSQDGGQVTVTGVLTFDELK